MIKINNKCRTCYNDFTRGLQSLTKITTDESNRLKSYAELLKEVTNINILNDKCSTKLPQAICGGCSRKLKAAHAFVQQAQQVNEKLYSMLLTEQGVEGGEGKPLDCLQEVQIDINACAKIKMEHNEDSDNSGNVDDMEEDELLEEGLQVKQEHTEGDILAESYSKDEEYDDEGNDLSECLELAYPSISLTTNMSDTEDNIPTNDFEITMDSSDNNNSNNEISSASDNDDEWADKSNNSNKKSPKKKTSPTKKQKKSDKTPKSTEKKNQDEWLQIKCNDCDKIFENSRLLKQHLRLNHVPEDLKIQCLYCETKFSRRHNMYAHMRRMHKSENLEEFQVQRKKTDAEKQYACQQCPRSYTNKYKLIAHVNNHHNPNNIKNIEAKEKAEQPKKRFLCTLCGLKFDSEGNLNIHFRRHTGERPYKCEFCDKCYPRLYDVQVHRRTHTGEKPYQCTLCEKTFRRSNKLKIHMRTHTNERPYKCTQCEKAFKQSKDLNIHKRTHTGERPYKCDVCQSTFTQSNSLRLHQIKQQHLMKPNPEENLQGAMTYLCPST